MTAATADKMFNPMIPGELEQLGLSDGAEALYLRFAKSADHRTGATPPLSARKMAERCRCSIATFWRRVKELTEAGVLRCEATWSCGTYGMRGPNRWFRPPVEGGKPNFLFDPELGDDAAADSAKPEPAAPSSAGGLPTVSEVRRMVLDNCYSGPAIQTWMHEKWGSILGRTPSLLKEDRKALRPAFVYMAGRNPRPNGERVFVVAVPAAAESSAIRSFVRLADFARAEGVALVLARGPEPPS